MDNQPICALKSVSKTYQQGNGAVVALAPHSMTIERGEIVALVGASGSGKSTLLHCAGLLLRPDAGEVWLDGKPCHRLSEREATMMRRHHLGFVYQFHHLLPELSAHENVMIPMMLQRIPASERSAKARAMLDAVGLSHRREHMPSELSGGEQQRVAIARALVHQPALLLADEPTGNLDPTSAAQVEAVMLEQLRARGASALIVTHNLELAARMDRVVQMVGG
ncbi:MAG: ABC transporter ATP-binding protein [Alphaproteobacteria bacterium]|nr:MAG: ABC transporter ATP-binding protein [Alphaproteobacteria bacterium]TAF76978.1 MAG: ABC transporter ATP-binding protein [Alphaproteobacteria bacterium]